MRWFDRKTGETVRRAIVGGGIWGQFHALFVPDAIEVKDIPEELRRVVLARLPGRDHKWYAAEATERGAFTAVDYYGGDPEQRLINLSLWSEPQHGPPELCRTITSTVRFDVPLYYLAQSSFEVLGEQSGRSTVVGGWVWDRRVKRIVGTTEDDREFSFDVVRGCWLLAPDEVTCAWRQFRAEDLRGQVIYGVETVEGA